MYIYRKERKNFHVLKDMLQLVKSHAHGKNISFSYVEAETALLPQLSLWDNLQLIVSADSWKDFVKSASKEMKPLLNLIKDPSILAQDAPKWECFLISMVKAFSVKNQHILVDMNEDLLSPFMVQTFKKFMMNHGQNKQIYLATASAGLWLDCAHCMVSRDKYEFVFERFDSESIRAHWAA